MKKIFICESDSSTTRLETLFQQIVELSANCLSNRSNEFIENYSIWKNSSRAILSNWISVISPLVGELLQEATHLSKRSFLYISLLTFSTFWNNILRGEKFPFRRHSNKGLHPRTPRRWKVSIPEGKGRVHTHDQEKRSWKSGCSMEVVRCLGAATKQEYDLEPWSPLGSMIDTKLEYGRQTERLPAWPEYWKRVARATRFASRLCRGIPAANRVVRVKPYVKLESWPPLRRLDPKSRLCLSWDSSTRSCSSHKAADAS